MREQWWRGLRCDSLVPNATKGYISNKDVDGWDSKVATQDIQTLVWAVTSGTWPYKSLREQFILWGLCGGGGSSSGGVTEVCCGKCPCKGSPWFLVGHRSPIVQRRYCKDLEKLGLFWQENSEGHQCEVAKLEICSLFCCWYQSVKW